MKALATFISVMLALAAAAAGILFVVKYLERRKSVLKHYDLYGDDVYDHEDAQWDEVGDESCCCCCDEAEEEPPKETQE